MYVDTSGNAVSRDDERDAPMGADDFHHIPKNVCLGHGSGGGLAADLLRHVFLPAYGNEVLDGLEDQATLPLTAGAPRVAMTTDAFVVRPLFFPGGDIGSLAVHGTVNNLAVGGAHPLYLSAAFILEEGFPLADLKRIVASMRRACDQAGVQLVTADTKVVDRGKGDGIFITTTGIGLVRPAVNLSIHSARPGDKILISGTMGDHGVAIMAARDGIAFDTVLESDSAPLNGLAEQILEACPRIRCMRDPTRGGVSSTLNDLAQASRVGVRIEEEALPLRLEVKAACEKLGLDPLYVASEGKLIAVVPAKDADRLLAAMRTHPRGRDAAIIGEVIGEPVGTVLMYARDGVERMVPRIADEQLSRIC